MQIDEGSKAREIIPWSPIPGRSLVPVRRDLVPVDTPPPVIEARSVDSPLHQLLHYPAADVRNLSPRQMSELSMDLYIGGALSWEEYSALAFQPELHPDYNRTIGALIGEQADPDRPQDFVQVWEERLAFEKRYNAEDPQSVANAGRIVDVLRTLAGITPVVEI
jgi:hypothetical protein